MSAVAPRSVNPAAKDYEISFVRKLDKGRDRFDMVIKSPEGEERLPVDGSVFDADSMDLFRSALEEIGLGVYSEMPKRVSHERYAAVKRAHEMTANFN